MNYKNGKLKVFSSEKNKLFFTSDLHFGHRNIMDYCNRPFTDIQHMDEQLIKNWNSVVPEDGIVVNSGDLTFYRKENADRLKYILSRLNGTMYLVPGNHDYSWMYDLLDKAGVIMTHKILEVQVYLDDNKKASQSISVCHYPLISFNHSHQGAWNLFGHHHGTYSADEKSRLRCNQMEIGVDCNNYFPFTYADVHFAINKQFMNRK